MRPDEVYKFCMRCGGSELKKESTDVLTCTECHFKHYLSPTPGISAIIENDQGQILLVKRANDPHIGEWDLPGGFIKTGEDAVDALKREILEELGGHIQVKGLLGAYADEYLYQGITVPTLNLYALGEIASSNLKPGDDVSKYRFFPRGEVLQQALAFKTVRQTLENYLSPKR